MGHLIAESTSILNLVLTQLKVISVNYIEIILIIQNGLFRILMVGTNSQKMVPSGKWRDNTFSYHIFTSLFFGT